MVASAKLQRLLPVNGVLATTPHQGFAASGCLRSLPLTRLRSRTSKICAWKIPAAKFTHFNVKQRPQPTRMACRRADFSVVGPTSVGHGGLKPFPTQGTRVACLGVSLLNMDVNVKQRPQPTRMACRRADFSVVGPTSVGHGGLKPFPTQGTHVSCLGVSLLNMDVSQALRAWFWSAASPVKLC